MGKALRKWDFILDRSLLETGQNSMTEFINLSWKDGRQERGESPVSLKREELLILAATGECLVIILHLNDAYGVITMQI